MAASVGLMTLLSAFAGKSDAGEMAGLYYTSLMAGDLATTKWAMDQGASERNYKSVEGAVVGNLAVAAALTFADSWLEKRDRKAQKLLRIGAGIGGGYLMLRSVRNGLKARQR